MKTDRYHEVELRLWASIGLDPVERVVTLSRLGTKVRVLDVGEGPPVLFVHGVSASGANWAPLVAHLDGFRCLLLDRPGCGLSAPLDDDLSDLDRFGAVADELVSDVLDGLDLPKAHVVATSLGGHLALRSAAAHPDRIDRMVEFGFVPGAPLTQLPMSMRMAALPGLGKLMTSIPPTRGTIRMILRRLGMGAALKDGRISPEMFDWFHALLRYTPTMRNDSDLPREFAQKAGTGAEVLPASLLSTVRCPILFAWGETDPMGGADVANSLVSLVPGAELEIWPETGHAPWMEHPERAAALVADFLADDQSGLQESQATTSDSAHGSAQRGPSETGTAADVKKILVSGCLNGRPIRFNETNVEVESAIWDRWESEGRLVSFCPELAAGFGVPRPPAEIAGTSASLVLQR
jgi:pimeloyl-ACP methyl ester carboxylesterase